MPWAELLQAILWIVAICVWLYGVTTPAARSKFYNLIFGWFTATWDVAEPMLEALASKLEPLVGKFAEAVKLYGEPIELELKALFAGKTRRIIDTTIQSQVNLGESKPEDAINRAALAMATAYGQGLASHGVSVAFEALFPEKLNTLNGIGPMFAQMAGFKEVSGAVLDPLYHNAFGRALEYRFRALFKPELPREQDAVEWHGRRLLTDAQLKKLFDYSGLKPEYEPAFIASAYRALSPFVLQKIADDTGFDPAKVKEAARFMGYREQDIDLLITGLEKQAIKSLRQSAVSAASANFVEGLTTQAGLNGELADLGLDEPARDMVLQAALRKRLLETTKDWLAMWDAEVEAGEITLAQYQTALHGLGYVDPVYSALSAKAHGKISARAFSQAVSAETALKHERTRVAVQGAMTAYHNREIDAKKLAALLLLAGLDAQTVALYVALAEARGQKKLPARK